MASDLAMNTVKMFVDSSGWIALFGKADKFHNRAAEACRALVNQSVCWMTNDYVLDETGTFLRRQYGLAIAQQVGNGILASPTTELIFVDEQTWQAAWEMFQAYDDKVWSFTDCTS